jgi:hypothetical protein
MAATAAKKKRLKQAREGIRNPELQRLNWNGLNPVSKLTPTLQEKKIRQNRKHRTMNPNLYQGDDSFFMSQINY